MDPLLAASLVNSAVQLGTAAVQNKQAKSIDTTRPIQTTPASALSAQKGLGSLTGVNMPGFEEAMSRLDKNFAITSRKATGSAGSSQEALDAIVRADETYANNSTDLAINNESFRTQATANYLSHLDKLAEFELSNFNYNEKEKFAENSSAKSALRNAVINNIYNGVSGFAGGVALNEELKMLGKNGKVDGNPSVVAKAGANTDGIGALRKKFDLSSIDTSLEAYLNKIRPDLASKLGKGLLPAEEEKFPPVYQKPGIDPNFQF